MSADEKLLVQKLTQGDQMAFELLFYRYRGKLYNFVSNSLPRQVDAEGLVHEVFLRIWAGRERIDPGQPFSQYIFRAARNLVIDHLRSCINKQVYLGDEIFVVDMDSDTSIAAEEKQLEEWFAANLDKLPEQRRNIFLMSRFEGHSYKEIASRLGITENTVDTQMRRALDFFRTELARLKILLFF